MPSVETIAAAYLDNAGGDAGAALREAIADALADLCEAERRTRRAERLISYGYARGRIAEPAPGPGGVAGSPNPTSYENNP